MRCLSAFASFDCAKKIQTLTHSQIHLAKWENVSVAPSCGNSCCRQQSSINLACILYLTDTHATCALCLCLDFSLLFFSAFASHFFSGNPSLLLSPSLSRSACILWMRRSRQTVYKQPSCCRRWRLNLPRLGSRTETCCALQHCYVPHS